jgi:hypothetical protein
VDGVWAKTCACGGGLDAATLDGSSNTTDGDATNGDATDGGATDGDAMGEGASDATVDHAVADASGDAATNAGEGGTPIGACTTSRGCAAACSDFPPAAILDGDAQAFDASSASGGPCILEPGDGALLPNNWVRPRFRWVGGSSPYQLTIHSGREANDLVVYTSNTQWTLPEVVWRQLAADAWDDGSGSDAIAVTVADANGGSQVHFRIAPASASGSVIYFTAAGDTNGWSWLEGFGVGDETAVPVLTPPTGPYANPATQVQWTLSRDTGGNLTTLNRDTDVALTPTGGVECIGCHVAVPDANSVTFIDFYPWDGVAAAVNPGSVGAIPPWLTPGGAETLSQGWLGMMSFSSGVWGPGNYRVIAGTQVSVPSANIPPWESGGSMTQSNLMWIDLGTSAPPTFSQNGVPLQSAFMGSAAYWANEGTTFGYIARSGDPNPSASCPTWSHDGSRIVYVSNDAAKDGDLGIGQGDLYTVPYANGAGGTATPLSGAATSTLNEYYPAFSPDDRYVAYTAGPAGASMYYNPDAEVYVIPSNGGMPTRLAANDPPVCLGAPSPGVTNAWPRWAPAPAICGGKTYYWLVFASSRLNVPFTVNSSTRNFKTGFADGPTSQLYVAGLIDDGTGTLQSFPGTYIWPQSTETSDGYAQSNHMPDWDFVNIP